MWICPNCETQNDDNDFFCVVCENARIRLSITNLSDVRMIPEESIRKKLENYIDENLWISIRNSPQKKDFEEYLRFFPSGRHHRAAKNRIANWYKEEEENLWKQVRLSDREQDYQHYMLTYPKGLYFVEAQKNLRKAIDNRKWNEAQKANTIKGYQEYLLSHPSPDDPISLQHIRSAEERIKVLTDEADWQQAKDANTLWAYELYLEMHRYPNSCIYRNEAHNKIKSMRQNQKQEMENEITTKTGREMTTASIILVSFFIAMLTVSIITIIIVLLAA